MTITINLNPEVEASLAAGARAQGLSVAEYARKLLEQLAPASATMSPAQRINKLHEWAANFPQRAAPLSDEAVSRESIYNRDQL